MAHVNPLVHYILVAMEQSGRASCIGLRSGDEDIWITVNSLNSLKKSFSDDLSFDMVCYPEQFDMKAAGHEWILNLTSNSRNRNWESPDLATFFPVWVTVAVLSAQSSLAILFWCQTWTKHFYSENCPSLDSLCFLDHSLTNFMVLWENGSSLAVSEILSPLCLETTTMTAQSHLLGLNFACLHYVYMHKCT